MVNYKLHSSGPLEVETLNTHALISGRAIVAGLLIAMFTMIGFLGLGLAFGGIGLDEETSARSAGIFTGVWFLVSAIGTVGSAAGSFIGKSGSLIAAGANRAAANPAVMNTVSTMTEDALGDLNLRSDPQIVAQGLGTRLFRGDTEGAKNYLARQAGISPAEADSRIASMKAQVDKVVADTKEATAIALRSAGWSLFLLVLLGALSSIAGGALGSVANFRKPLVREHEETYPRGGVRV